MNANFQNALSLGLVEPVMLKDGSHFSIGDTKYYMPAASGAKMAITRFHSALDIIRMHEELKLSYENNSTSWDMVKELATRILSTQDVKTIQDAALDIITVQNRVRARMEFGRDIEQVFRITAIYYLIEEEDPAVIDSAIIESKVNTFKQQPDLYAFFLSLPLNDLLNLSTVSDNVTMNYLKELNLQEILDLKIFLTKSKMYGASNDTISSITSQMETLSASVNLINSLSKNTTTS